MSRRRSLVRCRIIVLLEVAAVGFVSFVPSVASAESGPLTGEVAELWSERPRGEDTLVITTVDSSGRPKVVTRDGVDTTAEVAAVVAAADRLPGEAVTEWDGVAKIVGVNDPLRYTQWGHDAMSVETAWATAMGDGMVVAVVDSGVTAHPDLVSNLLSGRDFVDGDYDATDVHGHGTHVAGIIGAEADNGIGVAGAAPRAKILPVRVLDADGRGSWSSVANGITWATDNGADVINLSLGGPTRSTAVAAAIDYATSRNVVVVAAAGNDGPNAAPSWPAAEEKVLAVAATTLFGNVASYSSNGTYVDVAAAGDAVNSTVKSGGYAQWSGTSMASPQVAALAALVRQANPAMTEAEIRSHIQATAVDMAPVGRDVASGYGLVNFAAAVPPAPWTAPAPTNLVVTMSGLDLRVSASPVAASGVTGYELVRNGTTVDTSSAPTFSDGLRATIAGTYTYEIRARNAVGQVGMSSQATFTVAPPGIPTVTVAVSGRDAMVTPSPLAGPQVTGWMLYRNGKVASITSGPWPVGVFGLPYGSHTFTVRALGQSGVSGLSTGVTVQIAPPAPKVSVSRVDTDLVVTSSAVEGAARYEFTRNGVQVASGPDRTYSDSASALVAGPVSYGVRALVDGAWTDTVTTTFTVAPPAAPRVTGTTVGNDVRLEIVAPGATELLVYRNGVLDRTVAAATSVTVPSVGTVSAAWSVRSAHATGVSAMSNVVSIAAALPAPSTISVVRSGVDVTVSASPVVGARTYELSRNGAVVATTSMRTPVFTVRDGATLSGSVLYQVTAVTSSKVRSAPASTTWIGVIPPTPTLAAQVAGTSVLLTVDAPGAAEVLVYRNSSLVATRPATSPIVLTNEPFGPASFTVRTATSQGVSAPSASSTVTLASPTPALTVTVDRTDVLVQVAPIAGATSYQFFRDGKLVQSGNLPRFYDGSRATTAGTVTYGVIARQRYGASTPTGVGSITIAPPGAPTITGTGGRRTARINVTGWVPGDRIAIYVAGSLVTYGPASAAIDVPSRRAGTYVYTARIISATGASAPSAPITVTTT